MKQIAFFCENVMRFLKRKKSVILTKHLKKIYFCIFFTDPTKCFYTISKIQNWWKHISLQESNIGYTCTNSTFQCLFVCFFKESEHMSTIFYLFPWELWCYCTVFTWLHPSTEHFQVIFLHTEQWPGSAKPTWLHESWCHDSFFYKAQSLLHPNSVVFKQMCIESIVLQSDQWISNGV